jgi:hypothetical protein
MHNQHDRSLRQTSLDNKHFLPLVTRNQNHPAREKSHCPPLTYRHVNQCQKTFLMPPVGWKLITQHVAPYENENKDSRFGASRRVRVINRLQRLYVDDLAGAVSLGHPQSPVSEQRYACLR